MACYGRSYRTTNDGWTMYTIYGLVDPRDGRVRYVGMTTQTTEARLRGHMREMHRYPQAHKSRWPLRKIDIPRHKCRGAA